jgi:hypothetical protein
LTHTEIAELFQITQQNVTMHVQVIYDSGEAEDRSTSKNSLLVQNEGKRSIQRTVKLYDLSVILAIGYENGGIGRMRILTTNPTFGSKFLALPCLNEVESLAKFQ